MAVITIRVERPGRSAGAEFARPRGSRRGRRPAVVAAAAVATVAAAVGALLAGVPSAQASIVAIAPTVIASNVAMSGHSILALVVSGGSTTVPTDATRVQFAIAVTGATANGTVSSNPTASYPGSGDLVHYSSSGTGSGTIVERVGLSNQVTFHNNGPNGITVTIKITGYSTEVRASDVSGTGGSAGQVLTNTGTGAAWQPAGHAYGVANPFTVQALNTALTAVASVTVPAGNYVVNFTTTIAGSPDASPDNVGCYLFSPAGTELVAAYGNTDASDDQSVIALQGLVSGTTGGAITVQCVDSDATASVFYPTLIANSVGAVDGYSGAAPVRHASRPAGPKAVHS